MSTTTKELIIKVPFENGVEMEENLNKAIDELSAVLKKKGLMHMELKGVDMGLNNIYTVTIEDKKN